MEPPHSPYNPLIKDRRCSPILHAAVLSCSAPPQHPKPSPYRSASMRRAASCGRVHKQPPNASPVQGCDLIVAGAAGPIGVGLWAFLCWLRGARRERRRHSVRIPIREGSVASICGAHYLLTARPAFRLGPVCSSAGSGLSGSGLYTVLGRAFLTPLLALPRSSYPTSSVALRFVPLKRCSGASVVRA